MTLENFSLIFVESLVRKTLNEANFSVKNTQKELSLTNDIKLCHTILLKHLSELDAAYLEKLFETKNIFEILDQYINISP